MFKAPRIPGNAGGCNYFLHPHPFFAVFAAGFFAAGFFAVFFAVAMLSLLLRLLFLKRLSCALAHQVENIFIKPMPRCQ